MIEKTPPDSDRLVAVDAAVIAVVSLAICLWCRRLGWMTILVPAVILARLAVLARFARHEVNLRAEVLFLAICTLVGAFNDWNSVVRHRIYDYTVPHEFAWSTIPIWMLLFWGMILRFFARLARWRRLSPPEWPSDRIGFGRFSVENGFLKVAALLTLIFGTRQAIYHYYLDPLWSWLPFLFGVALYLMLFHSTRHDLRLVGLFLVGGPLIEMLYIQVGGLHRYPLGWLFGVPLWIVVWWLLAVLVWKDLAFRLERGLGRFFAEPR